MGKHAQLVIGPAGSGKSSYCTAVYQHCCTQRRTVHVINLDPAAETFKYPVSIDIRDLISLDDVSEELKLGPNGGLIFCMEYLIENIQWLEKKIGEYEDDYLIIDCPGQIELYTLSIFILIDRQYPIHNPCTKHRHIPVKQLVLDQCL